MRERARCCPGVAQVTPPEVGFERDDSWEGGQANGSGVIEPNDNRPWFSPERTSHRRHVITLNGHRELIPGGHQRTVAEDPTPQVTLTAAEGTARRAA